MKSIIESIIRLWFVFLMAILFIELMFMVAA
jgi:hypothetical protein